MANKRDPEVQVLLDKQEIYECLMRYCRGVDRCDIEVLRSAYHPDAVDHHGAFDGPAMDFCTWGEQALKTMKWTMHSISNVLIDVKGDVAYCESYYNAYHRVEYNGKDVDFILGGRYVDRFERRNGVWKIAERYCLFDWNHCYETTEDWESPLAKGDYVNRGRRDKQDISYTKAKILTD